jgi:hypothetical protein
MKPAESMSWCRTTITRSIAASRTVAEHIVWYQTIFYGRCCRSH